MTLRSVKNLFRVAAVYDIALGLGFGLAFKPIYARFGITLPNHDAYIQLPALFVLVFGIGFYMVSRDPVRHQGIMVLGVLMKLAYVVVILGHWLAASIPTIYLPFAVCDALFALLFLLALRATGRERMRLPT